MNEKERKAKNNKPPSNDYVIIITDKKTGEETREYRTAPPVPDEVYNDESI